MKILFTLLVCFFVFNAPAFAGVNENRRLFTAIENHDFKEIEMALNAGADINGQNPDAKINQTPMQLVAQLSLYDGYNLVQLAEFLLGRGAKINKFDKILFLPISGGNAPLVKLLVENGAHINMKIEGFTPHQIALKYNQDQIAKYLEEKGAVITPHKVALQTQLIQAVSDKDISKLDALLAAGSDINKDDGTGRTALLQACRMGAYSKEDYEVISYLLDKEADPNKSGESGFRGVGGLPLHVFIVMNVHSMNKVSHKNKYSIKSIKKLLKVGAKVSGIDASGKTPLHMAAEFDNVVAAEILIKNGSKVMPKDNKGKTPLDYAESAEMILLLKKSGAKEL